ncbi:hypothetical protein EDD18DRAFT_182360 [Armillaria luteobubalina]|uniref:F-box domain-containing protein n=1 Tax=Armillaria luteobubalina TaxID=153913 RepID=A0AA39Q694_9AGAR|nr:hypothetical protein EDD18DRAFT_182360 [Armillaria luteobubalina]
MQQGEAPSFPLETFEKIIDSFSESDDKSPLLICSLVCRTWVRRSRYHYFRKFHAWEEEACISLLQMISEPYTSITASTIRELDVGEHQYRDRPWVVKYFPLLLKALPGVEALSLSHINYNASSSYELIQPSGRVLHGFPPQLPWPSVTSLTFTGCCFQSFRQLFVVLNRFSSLEDLTLEHLVFVDQNCGTLRPNFAEDRRVPHLTCLKRLRLDDIPLSSSQDRFHFWFVYPLTNVEVLSVRMPKGLHGWKMLKQMLYGLRKSLVELELRESCDLYGDPGGYDLELGLYSVHTIVFSGIRHRRSDGPRHLRASMIPTIFFQIRDSPDLERVIFDVDDRDVIAAMEELKAPIKAIEWALHQKPVLDGVKELIVRTNHQSWVLAVHASVIDKLFERLVKKGIAVKMESSRR